MRDSEIYYLDIRYKICGGAFNINRVLLNSAPGALVKKTKREIFILKTSLFTFFKL
jgi:hypothetical protein